jgi:hypothetical protein
MWMQISLGMIVCLMSLETGPHQGDNCQVHEQVLKEGITNVIYSLESTERTKN